MNTGTPAVSGEGSMGVIEPYHVVPIGDLREHKMTVDCWCRPVDDDGVIIHNSMDRREVYERGELLPS
jgi:hypothetical protein